MCFLLCISAVMMQGDVFFSFFLIYLGVHSGVITCSSIKPRAGMLTEHFDYREGFSLLICPEHLISNGR